MLRRYKDKKDTIHTLLELDIILWLCLKTTNVLKKVCSKCDRNKVEKEIRGVRGKKRKGD